MAWTAPTMRSVGDLVTAAIWNVDGVANLIALKVEADKMNALAADQLVRTFGSTYQNTSGKTRFVTVVAQVTDSEHGDMVAYVENDATPAVAVARAFMDRDAGVSIIMVSISFLVPNGWYYKTDGDVDVSVYEWTEWELH